MHAPIKIFNFYRRLFINFVFTPSEYFIDFSFFSVITINLLFIKTAYKNLYLWNFYVG